MGRSLQSMTDLDGDIRDALDQARIHGPHSAKGSDAWVAIADIVRRIASQVRYASVPSSTIDPDDVAASMLVRLQSAALRQRIIDAKSPTAYLRGMARYVLIDQLRQSEKTISLETTAPVATIDPGDLGASGNPPGIAIERLQSALAGLTPAERTLVRQRFWEGMSVADIARGLGEPYSRVVVRIFRLTRKLRRALESS
jgi:RNA polymerase sigma factor (sigma-70 family)